jgi:3'-5' exoribonuclease
VFAEALLLHHLDNLDSKMESMRSAVDKDRHVEGWWTSFNSPLDRAVLKKLRFLEERREPAVVPVADPPGVRDAIPPADPARAAQPAVRQATGSLFGDKLKEALKSG